MHGSYKVGRPLQVIRYDNRIEITNAGYSLKPTERLGSPGSIPRNKTLAPVFHDTNLAETKGSGIKRMRTLMKEAHLALPTFESDREGNAFTIRLLLHHFLGPEDLKWLEQFSSYGFNDNQKTALIFLRETGAIDNPAYRQICGCETLKASYELRKLRDAGVVKLKGRGTATYYIPKWESDKKDLVDSTPSMVDSAPSMVDSAPSMIGSAPSMIGSVSGTTLEMDVKLAEIAQKAQKRSKRSNLEDVIYEMCHIKALEREEIARLTKRSNIYMRLVLKGMISNGRLRYKYPEMIKHPRQAYMAIPKEPESE